MAKKKVLPEVNITLVIDRSGSMASIHKEVIGGLNAFLAEQKKLPETANVTAIQFDNYYNTMFTTKPLTTVEDFDSQDFVPRGMTALYDAIGMTIANIDKKTKSPQIIVIFTDGEENSSKEYDHEKVKDKIKEAKDLGWVIIFMGANIDAIALGSGLGIDKDKTVTYAASAVGSVSATMAMSNKISSMRCSYSTSTQDWYAAGGDLNTNYATIVTNSK